MTVATMKQNRTMPRGAALALCTLWVLAVGPLQAQEIQPEEPEAAGDFFVELTPESELAIGRGLRYLARTQLPSGGWSSRYGDNNLGVNALALLAFLAAGRTPADDTFGLVVNRGVQMILESASPTGLIVRPDATSHGPMYEHALATLLLSEVYGMCEFPRLRETLQKAVDLIVNTQNNEGGWRYQPRRFDADISVTVMQVVALRSSKNAGIGVPESTIGKAKAYVRSCADASGGFTYMAGTGKPGYGRTAAGVCSLQVTGDYSSEEVLKGLTYLLAQRESGRGGYYFYGHYYAAQAVYQARDPQLWQQWFPPVREELLSSQGEGGEWNDDVGPAFGTAMAVLILTVPYRYLPIYQR